MDQRLIDAYDPTSFGGDIIKAKEDQKNDMYMPGDEDQITEDGQAKKTTKRSDTVTIITEDRDWGDRGHGQPVLLQHGHHLDSEIWFKEKKAGKPIPLQLFDAGYDVWLGNNRGSYNCKL